jgi:two-component system, cell cycle sensor histidine kinase and response regulator CckA
MSCIFQSRSRRLRAPNQYAARVILTNPTDNHFCNSSLTAAPTALANRVFDASESGPVPSIPCATSGKARRMSKAGGDSESEVVRLSRLHAALREINQTLVRATDRTDLFDRMCRLLVERAGFHIAWIGCVDPETSQLKPVARSGALPSLLDRARAHTDSRAHEQGPTISAFRSGEPVVIEDLSKDTSVAAWNDLVSDAELCSAAAFPIRERGKVVGTLTVYSARPVWFREHDVTLLADAANGISFVLDRLRLDEERARALDRLERERDFSEGVINSLPGVLYLYDSGGKFLRWNRRFETVTEYSAEEISSMHALDFFGGADVELVRARIVEAFSQGQSSVEAGFVSKSGRVTPFFFTGIAAKIEDKPCLIGVGIDISERKRAEADLAESEALLSIAGRAARVGGWTVAIPEQVVRWSDEMRELLDVAIGYQPTLDEAYGFYEPQSRAVVATKFEECAREGRPFDLELEMDTAAGRRISVRVVAEAHRNHEGQVVRVQGALQDISEQVRLAQQYRQAQKMEAIGLLAGGVAHDFNNLLSVILSYSAILGDQFAAESPARNDVEEIRRAAERAADLTQQLLAFGRQQLLQPRVFVLSETVAGMQRMLSRLLGEHIELSFFSRVPSGNVFADPTQVEQVVMNLALNARDAMPGGGKLTIEIADADLDTAYASEHVGVEPGDYVVLAVSDSGIGMDAKTKERIFEPFFTTKDKAKGTGLGLATVFGIVKQSRGHIWVYSEVGKGSTFRVYFPRTAQVPAEVSHTAAAPLVLRGTETVLLVEDEEQLRLVTRSILERNGYRVLDACNGEHAIAVCEASTEEIVLLITDVVMPRMNGRKLADQLLALRPALKVLFMSGYTENSIVHHGVLDEGIQFLPKPLTPAALLRKVREVLDEPALGRN